MIICFDVDGTLFDYEDQPRKEVIALLRALKGANNKVYIWSGNGYEYASLRARDLKLEKVVDGILSKYTDIVPDIAIDDKDVKLGKVNIKI